MSGKGPENNTLAGRKADQGLEGTKKLKELLISNKTNRAGGEGARVFRSRTGGRIREVGRVLRSVHRKDKKRADE